MKPQVEPEILPKQPCLVCRYFMRKLAVEYMASHSDDNLLRVAEAYRDRLCPGHPIEVMELIAAVCGGAK